MKPRLVGLLGFFLVLFTPSQFGLHFWPSFASPSGFPIDYLSPTLYFTDILCLLFVLFAHPPSSNFKFLFLISIVNLLPSKYFPIVLVHWLRIYQYYLVFKCFQKYPHYFKYWLAALSLAVLWVSVLAILQFFSGHNLGGFWYFLGERPLSLSLPYVSKVYLSGFGFFLRPYATFPHPNALAGYLLVSLITLISYKKNWITGLLGYWIILFACFALLLTFSKTILFPLIFITPRSLLSTTLSERFSQFPAWWTIFSSHPLTGIGLGAYPAAVVNYPTSVFQLSYQPIHNAFLLLLAELGLPLFVILIYFLTSNLINLLKTGNWLFVTALLLTSMLDHYWLTSSSNLLLLTLAFALVKSSRVRS